MSRYIVLNPVRAGMVKEVSRWPWSSYSATVGIIPPPDYLSIDWLLGLFSVKRKTAQKRYREFVAEGISAESPWNNLTASVLLGDAKFIGSLEPYLSDKELIKEIPRSARFVYRPPLKKLFTSKMTKTERDDAIRSAHLNYGYTLKDIADHLKIHSATASRAVAGEKKR